MDNSQQELINDFVLESREHLTQLEPDLLGLESAGESTDATVINRIFRSVHSIKGASGFLALEKINSLSHLMESLLMKIRDGDMSPTPELVDALLAGTDRLRAMIDDIDASDTYNIEEEMARLSALLPENAGKAKTAPVKAPKTEPKAAAGKPTDELNAEELAHAKAHGQLLFKVVVHPQADLFAHHLTPNSLLEKAKSIGSILAGEVALATLNESTDVQELTLVVATVLEQDLLASALGLGMESIVLFEDNPPKAEPKATEPVRHAEPEMLKSEHEVVESKPVAENTGSAATVQASGGQETLRVKVSLLNNLMNLAGELVLGRNQLAQILSQHASEIRGINAMVQNLNLITTELQENIMQTRMQPVGNVFNKFPRLMRDLSRRLKKEAELQLVGSEVELDKSIIESLSDPLTHLIRNTIDHGIESPDERETAGKSRAGRVLLRAYHEAGMVNIEIVDDGKGIDIAVIRANAIQKGLVGEQDAERMSEREIYSFLFAPGFSTAKTVTDVSGRGVGMDVVKTNIERLGGTVDIESTKGQGTRVNLRLPLTLAIIPSLIVKVNDEKFAIPQVSIEELVRIRAKDSHKAIEKVNGADVLRLRDKLLPLVRLADVLGIERIFIDASTGAEKTDRRNRLADRRVASYGKDFSIDEESGQLVAERPNSDLPPEIGPVSTPGNRRGRKDDNRRWHKESAITILVLKSGNNRFGLVVSNIADNEEIVVKALSKYIKDNVCYAGTTIMGDGSVAMILDPQGIAETAGLRFEELDRAAVAIQKDYQRAAMREKQSLLIFANGPTETFAMSLALIKRLEKVPVSEIEHIGEKEYLKYRGGSLRLIRLDDYLPISRPENDQKVLHIIVPKMTKKPVGIVATEVLDVLETDLELDTQNIKATGLLGSAIINDRITLVLDMFALFDKIDITICGGAEAVRADQGTAYRILLAEDTPFFKQLEYGYMTSAGHQVDVASNGEEALDLLLHNKYDIVISDIVMPQMDGYELVKRIRDNEKINKVPVMAMTSLDDESSKQRALEAGFNAYEVKIDKERMLRRINDLICGEARQ